MRAAARRSRSARSPASRSSSSASAKSRTRSKPFHPDRVAQRILGMGDMLSLIEKVEESIDQKSAEEMQRKLIEDDFTLADFRDQMKQLRKLGPLESILGMMPQMGPLKDLKNVKVDEKEITRIVAIVDSMTAKERANHMIINGARRRRIAKGSGTSVQEVNNLLKQYAQTRKMMKSITGGGRLSGQAPGQVQTAHGFRTIVFGKLLSTIDLIWNEGVNGMLMIRLARFGAKKKPAYRVVVIDKERARDSRSVEVVGTYSPVAKPKSRDPEARPHRALDEERRAALGHGGPAVEDQSGARARPAAAA